MKKVFFTLVVGLLVFGTSFVYANGVSSTSASDESVIDQVLAITKDLSAKKAEEKAVVAAQLQSIFSEVRGRLVHSYRDLYRHNLDLESETEHYYRWHGTTPGNRSLEQRNQNITYGFKDLNELSNDKIPTIEREIAPIQDRITEIGNDKSGTIAEKIAEAKRIAANIGRTGVAQVDYDRGFTQLQSISSEISELERERREKKSELAQKEAAKKELVRQRDILVKREAQFKGVISKLVNGDSESNKPSLHKSARSVKEDFQTLAFVAKHIVDKRDELRTSALGTPDKSYESFKLPALHKDAQRYVFDEISANDGTELGRVSLKKVFEDFGLDSKVVPANFNAKLKRILENYDGLQTQEAYWSAQEGQVCENCGHVKQVVKATDSIKAEHSFCPNCHTLSFASAPAVERKAAVEAPAAVDSATCHVPDSIEIDIFDDHFVISGEHQALVNTLVEARDVLLEVSDSLDELDKIVDRNLNEINERNLEAENVKYDGFYDSLIGFATQLQENRSIDAASISHDLEELKSSILKQQGKVEGIVDFLKTDDLD